MPRAPSGDPTHTSGMGMRRRDLLLRCTPGSAVYVGWHGGIITFCCITCHTGPSLWHHLPTFVHSFWGLSKFQDTRHRPLGPNPGSITHPVTTTSMPWPLSQCSLHTSMSLFHTYLSSHASRRHPWADGGWRHACCSVCILP